MNKINSHRLLSMFYISTFTFCANADQTFTMEQITGSLQNEYQTQLQAHQRRKPQQVRRNTKPRVAPVSNWTAPAQRRVPQQQRQQQPKKPEVPHQDRLFNAASNGSVQTIAQLIQQGVNVNSANPQRETALHMAAAKGQYSAVIYLINHGANIHARTVSNWLPIHHATRFRHANIAHYLLQRGSSPHARTSDGLSAIDMARAVRDQRLLGVFGAR
jgi:hypothetical protein